MSSKNTVKRRVFLSMCTMPHYTEPCNKWKKDHPMRYYNVATYLNNHRIGGARDYGGSVVHCRNINTIDVLRALEIPEEIINQIPFEDEGKE